MREIIIKKVMRKLEASNTSQISKITKLMNKFDWDSYVEGKEKEEPKEMFALLKEAALDSANDIFNEAFKKSDYGKNPKRHYDMLFVFEKDEKPNLLGMDVF